VAKIRVPAVDTHGVGGEQPFHAGDQVALRRLDHQMKVIVHEAPGMHLPGGLLTSLRQSFNEEPSVRIVEEARNTDDLWQWKRPTLFWPQEIKIPEDMVKVTSNFDSLADLVKRSPDLEI
jgi:hypothetical protein